MVPTATKRDQKEFIVKEDIKRTKLNEDDLVEVNGGMLSIRRLEDNNCYLQMRDEDFNVLTQYKLKHARQASAILADMYWSFDPGCRDQQMIEWFMANGYIDA